jgi:hypothetical protein
MHRERPGLGPSDEAQADALYGEEPHAYAEPRYEQRPQPGYEQRPEPGYEQRPEPGYEPAVFPERDDIYVKRSYEFGDDGYTRSTDAAADSIERLERAVDRLEKIERLERAVDRLEKAVTRIEDASQE